MRTVWIFIIWCLVITKPQLSVSQTREIDSLMHMLPGMAEDTNKIKTLNELSWKLLNSGNFDSILSYGAIAQELSKKLDYKRGLARSLTNTGIMFKEQGDFGKALDYYFQALRIQEQIQYKKGMSSSYNNIGLIYSNQKDYQNAIKNYSKSLTLKREIGDTRGLAVSYSNLTLIYIKLNNYQEAFKNVDMALSIFQKLKDQQGIATCYNNIGDIYKAQLNCEKALEYNLKALEIYKTSNYKTGLAGAYGDIGSIYLLCGKYKTALEYTFKSLKLQKELGALNDIQEAELSLSQIYEAMKDGNTALVHYKQYIIYRDSVYNEKSTKKIISSQIQYDFDKKQVAAKLDQEKREAVMLVEKNKQRVILYVVSIAMILILIFAVYAYRSFLQKRKANLDISAKNEIIEKKQQEILASIRYAKKLQAALMPQEKYIERNLNRLNPNKVEHVV